MIGILKLAKNTFNKSRHGVLAAPLLELLKQKKGV